MSGVPLLCCDFPDFSQECAGHVLAFFGGNQAHEGTGLSAIRYQRSGSKKRLTQRSQRSQSSRRRGTQDRGTHSLPGARGGKGKKKQIPPLRGPTRQNAARKKKSGRYGRDDNSWKAALRSSLRGLGQAGQQAAALRTCGTEAECSICGRVEACDTVRNRVGQGGMPPLTKKQVRCGPCLLKFCQLARSIPIRG